MAREAAIKSDPARLAEWKEQRKRQHAKRMRDPEFVARKRANGRKTEVRRNRLKRNADQVERRRRNPALAELVRKRNAEYQKANPEVFRASRHRRRARRQKAKGSFDRGNVFLILTAQGFRCFWCDADITRKHQIDHFIPLARRGSNWPSNIVMSCARCNQQRRDKMPDEFTTWRSKMAQRIAGIAFLKVDG